MEPERYTVFPCRLARLFVSVPSLFISSYFPVSLRSVLFDHQVPQLDNNRVFAAWMQKQVLFLGSDGTVWGLGDAERALGPNAVEMDVNADKLAVFHPPFLAKTFFVILLFSRDNFMFTTAITWTPMIEARFLGCSLPCVSSFDRLAQL